MALDWLLPGSNQTDSTRLTFFEKEKENKLKLCTFVIQYEDFLDLGKYLSPHLCIFLSFYKNFLVSINVMFKE